MYAIGVSRLSIVLLLISGCGRVGYESRWDHILVVDVAEDRLAGPTSIRSPGDVEGEGLSFREALHIAANDVGTDLIVLAPEMGGAVVALGSDLPPIEGDDVEVRGEGLSLDASATSGPVLVVRGDRVIVQGLTIVNAPGDAIVVEDCESPQIWFNTIVEPAGRGIVVTGSNNAWVKANDIRLAGGDLVFVADSSNVHFAYNTLVIGDKGAQRGSRFERVTDSVLCHNLIDPGAARLIDLFESSRNQICDNVLDRGDAGVVLEGASHDNVVFQNRIIASNYDGVYVSWEATGNTVVHNTMLRCSTPLVNEAADTIEGNNLGTNDDALFVAPGPPEYDFTLVAGSAYIDAGEDLGFDLLPDDEATFLGAAPDVGAIESY